MEALVDDLAIEEVDNIYQQDAIQNKSLTVEVKLDGKPLSMELDTGVSVSLISEVTYKSLLKDKPIRKSKTKYYKELLKVTGEVTVLVAYGTHQEELLLVVVEGDGPSLFGRNWLHRIQLSWAEVKAV